MSEKSTKILYVITKSVWGGAQKYVFDLAHSINSGQASSLTQGRLGSSFEVCVAGGPRGAMVEKLKELNIPYYEIYNFQRDINVLKEFLAFFEILKLLFKIKPDIIHVSSSKAGGIAGVAFFIYSLIGGSVMSFWNHFPYDRDGKTMLPTRRPQSIFTIHGWAFNESRPTWQIFLIKFFSKLTCLFYDKIICVSQYDYDCAVKNKITPAKKIVMIHNGIKPSDYDFLNKEEAKEEIAKQAHLFRNHFPYDRDEETNAPAKLLVGTIGEFTKNKGQKYLIEAVKQLSNNSYQLSVFIIGWGEEKENLKSQISNLKLENQVFLIENLPEASKYLKAFDIFTLPSIKEGLSYMLIETGLAGLPIITTRVGGTLEIIGLTEGILVEPANPQALADAIKTLIQDPLLRQGYGGRLREKVLTEFSLDRMLEETVKLYTPLGYRISK